MGGDGFAGRHQLLHQRVAKQHQLGLRPPRAVGDQQAVPIARQQRGPQHGGCGRRCQQQRTVFIEHGDGIAHGATHRAHALGGNGLGLQAVERGLGLREAQPHQAVEKIVQVVAGGHLGGAADEGFVGLAGWGRIGGGKPHGAALRVSGGVQRLGHRAATSPLGHCGPHPRQRVQPGAVPVHGGQARAGKTFRTHFTSQNGTQRLLVLGF